MIELFARHYSGLFPQRMKFEYILGKLKKRMGKKEYSLREEIFTVHFLIDHIQMYTAKSCLSVNNIIPVYVTVSNPLLRFYKSEFSIVQNNVYFSTTINKELTSISGVY